MRKETRKRQADHLDRQKPARFRFPPAPSRSSSKLLAGNSGYFYQRQVCPQNCCTSRSPTTQKLLSGLGSALLDSPSPSLPLGRCALVQLVLRDTSTLVPPWTSCSCWSAFISVLLCFFCYCSGHIASMPLEQTITIVNNSGKIISTVCRFSPLHPSLPLHLWPPSIISLSARAVSIYAV